MSNHTFEIIPLTIEAKGEVISSNVAEFRDLVREALANINRDLKTDEEFGQAELDAKALKGAEDTVKAAKDKALADAESLHLLFSQLDETSEEIRVARLDLETQIKKRKEEVKTEIVETALATFDIDPGLARRTYLASLQNAIKGKRTLESMWTAVNTVSVTHQGTIHKCRKMIESFSKTHGKDLVMDARELELKTPDSVEGELRRRFEAKKAAEESARLKAEADAAKVEADTVSIGDAHSATGNATAAEEWAQFKTMCLAAFKPLKEAREGLTHSANIAKAQGFANAINQAWKEWA